MCTHTLVYNISITVHFWVNTDKVILCMLPLCTQGHWLFVKLWKFTQTDTHAWQCFCVGVLWLLCVYLLACCMVQSQQWHQLQISVYVRWRTTKDNLHSCPSVISLPCLILCDILLLYTAVEVKEAYRTRACMVISCSGEHKSSPCSCTLSLVTITAYTLYIYI